MSSYSFEDLKFKLKRRIKNFKIARSVIRINPFFNKLSYRAKIGKFRSYNSNDNILIIGCAGTIGSALAKQFKTKKANVYGTYFKTKPDPNTIPSQKTFQLDIRSSQSIYNLFELKGI